MAERRDDDYDYAEISVQQNYLPPRVFASALGEMPDDCLGIDNTPLLPPVLMQTGERFENFPDDFSVRATLKR